MQNQGQDAPWNALDNMSDDDQGLDIWGFLQRRKAFIILLAMVGAGLGYLYFQRQIPRYRSSALLQVIHHSTDPRVESLLAERNLSDAPFVITSATLLQPCFENHNLQELETFRGMKPEEAIQKLAGMVSAVPQERAANILLLSSEGANPGDTAQIANAVSEDFIAHQKKSYESAVSKLGELLNQAVEKLNASLTILERDYQEFDKTSPLSSDGENPHRQQLAGIQSKTNALVIRQAEIKAELLALEHAIQTGGQREALLLMIGQQSQLNVKEATAAVKEAQVDPAMAEAVKNARNRFQTLMPLLMEEALMAEELGGGHPKLQSIRHRIQMTQDYFDRLEGMKLPELKSEQPEVVQEKQRFDFLEVYVDSLRQELLTIARQQDELLALANQEEAAAKNLREYEHQRANFERRIARETSLLEDVQQQMRDTELPTNMGGVSATILTEARHGTLVYPKLSQFLGLGAFLGAFVGLALGYLVEIADRSFRKPEDIIREFGVPILGHIPYMLEKSLKKVAAETSIDRTVVALHLPRSRPSEAYRSVRTAVCFSALGSKHRLIQVTSPAAGDGKSTLAMNFAVSLAQSGKKTLILESDFRRPKVHKLTGVSNAVGVVDVLRGTAELTDAIHETELEGFHVMPCGSRPRNPSELLTRPEYEHLLETLRDKYEYVIIDTPPVLVVTDPCSVAPRADGVLLCVRLSRQTRDFGRRALEQLRDVGANMTGIVINGVEESDSYGYGNYSYSDYRYRYKDYSYNYRYGDKQNEAYFDDADAESSAEISAR